MTDPQAWLRDYRAQGEDMVRRSQEFSEQLREVTETASSRDGAVTVTVTPSGALQDLVFSPRARELSEGQLAQLTLQTSREAQARVAHRVAELAAPVIGDGDSMAFLRGQLPPLDDQPPHRDGEGPDDFDGPVLR